MNPDELDGYPEDFEIEEDEMETDNGVETEDFLNENSEGDELEEVSGYNEDDEADPEFDFDPEDTDDGQEEYTDADLF